MPAADSVSPSYSCFMVPFLQSPLASVSKEREARDRKSLNPCPAYSCTVADCPLFHCLAPVTSKWSTFPVLLCGLVHPLGFNFQHLRVAAVQTSASRTLRLPAVFLMSPHYMTYGHLQLDTPLCPSSTLQCLETLNDLNPTKNSGPEIVHAISCEKYAAHTAMADKWPCATGGALPTTPVPACMGPGRIPTDVRRPRRIDPIPESTFPQYLDVLAPYVNQVNLIRAGVPKINFSGPDYPSIRPPILILSIKSWPGVSEKQVYHKFQNLCKFDVRRLTRSQFLLLTNKFKDARNILKEYRGHPTLHISLYRYWRHSPDVNCLLHALHCGQGPDVHSDLAHPTALITSAPLDGPELEELEAAPQPGFVDQAYFLSSARCC
ncbi:hypothetical protein P7K49_008896 [Saguinus oedipus]|uniref:Uncharacterized protein n=1 Tax=Saguinus oedipus TaxID=9490 RepID=A0ABQ9VZS1_SAGOE|nr:hypothetical protein P7K49_008896 [Saguinus oedipus]